MNPFNEFSTYFELHFPLNETFASEYSARIDTLNSNLKKTPPNVYNPVIEEAGIISGGSNNPNQMYTIANFKSASKYFPDSNSETRVRKNLQHINLRYAFFKDSLPENIDLAKLRNSSNLLLQTTSDVNQLDGKYSHWLAIYTSETGIILRSTGFNTVKENQWVRDSGDITSLYDLLGTYMVIFNQEADMHYNFKTLKIRLAPGKTLDVPTDKINTYSLDNGRLLHIYQFPHKMNEIKFETRGYPDDFY